MPRLPLTLIEQYFFAENKDAHPCWIHYRFRIRGRLDPVALREAWKQTVRRHVTLHSIVHRDSRGALFWETAATDHEPLFVWKSAASINAAPDQWTQLDITREPAVRLTVVASEETDACELLLEGQHTIFDGLAMFDVAHDLFVAYARQLGRDVAPPELRPDLFPARGKFGLNLWQRVLLAPKKLIGLGFAWQMHRRKVVPLNPGASAKNESSSQGPPVGFPVVLHDVLPAGELEKLRASARRHGASLNDLFIRDVQAAIGAWRTQNHIGVPEDWIYVAVPVNLRGAVDPSLPAANMIGLVLIDRQARSLANRPRLLRRAHEDMGLVKRHHFAFAFLAQLAALRLRRGGIARYCDADRCRSTVVLTNLGSPFSGSPLLDASQRIALPDALVEDCVVIAPCRPGTAATIAVTTYGGRLAIDVHVDPRALNKRQADAFLAALLDQLRASAAK